MIIKYKKINMNTMKLSAETYEGELFYDEFEIISEHQKGILIYSFSKGKIVIIDTDTGVDLKKLKPSEYMDFIYENCEHSKIDWNPELDGSFEIDVIDGKLVIVNDTTLDENGNLKIKYKPGYRYYKSDEDERKYNPYFEG